MLADTGQKMLSAVYHDFMVNGANMFIATRLAPSEQEHAIAYYQFMQPKHSAVIVDMGSGIGEHGEWFRAIDSSLRIINIVNDSSLMDIMKSSGRPCIYASYVETGLPDQCADIVMFNESLGYEPLNQGFREAARILKDGGEVIIKDFSIVDPLMSGFTLDNWEYRINKDDEIIAEAANHGLSIHTLIHPAVYIKHWYDMIEASERIKGSASEHDPDGLPLCTSLFKFKKGKLNGRVD